MPMEPSVRPVRPVPIWSIFSPQRPARVSRSLIRTFCASISTKVSAEVATGRRTPSGAMVSNTPALVQADVPGTHVVTLKV